LVDVVWVVSVSEETQLERLMKRNGYTAEEAENRIASQMSDDARRQFAHAVIDNNGTVAETIAQVEQLLYNISVSAQ
ncbi:MAG: dephospho-CoA kinase, partial [Peptococcaceae bacterium]|nr:dephospho-CoA kinase [Peptococcaceae bacterium]